VWTHADTGGKWGIVAGVLFALLNALIVYAMTDPVVAICLGAAFLTLLIPRFGPAIAPWVLGLLGLMGKFGVALGLSIAVIAWLILLGLPGMTIGGAVGWVREQKLPRAPDAPAEGDAIVIKAVLLPLIGSLLAWGVFIFVVYPWAVSVAGSSPFGLLSK